MRALPPTLVALLLASSLPGSALDRAPGDPLDARFDAALDLADRSETRRTIERDVDPRGRISVRDVASGVGLRATLHDAVPRRRIVDVGRGLEDWVGFAAPPARDSIRYRVETSGAAGVRLVGRTLELLDASGAPRLRMAPPWLLDADGARVELDVRVTGCAHDDDPRAPFGRPVVAPGAACEVELSWAGAEVAYPIVVDPTWSATDSLATGRREMAIGRLASGLVVVAGGAVGALTSITPTASAELFDPATETFAATTSLPTARARPWFATLAPGTLLVGGGASGAGLGGNVAPGAELYAPATGTWTPTMPPTPRVWADAVRLADGTVLVVGGKLDAYFGLTATRTAERFDPVGGTWSAAGMMGTARYGNFVLQRLQTGSVLVAGGWDGVSTTHATAELYDPATNAWTPTGSLATGRGTGLFGMLASGHVVVAGGTANIAGALTNVATTEVYDPATGLFSPAGPIGAPVDYRTNGAVTWTDGSIVAPAGVGTRGLYSERFDPLSRTWETGCDPSRTYLAAVGSVTLLDGRVLVVGGIDASGTLATAWLSGPEAGACDDGNFCTNDGCDVTSGACVSTPNTRVCDDGDACTIGDVCGASVCAGTEIAGCSDAGVADAGEPDAGEPDAGEPDAGDEADAGEADAGAEVDAGTTTDAGSGMDAGGGVDAGATIDGGRDAGGGTIAHERGCSCGVGAAQPSAGVLALLLGLVGIVVARRRH